MAAKSVKRKSAKAKAARRVKPQLFSQAAKPTARPSSNRVFSETYESLRIPTIARKSLWRQARERFFGQPPMRSQMDLVKAGVLHELETMSQAKGIALSGRPFQNIVLPQVRRKRRWLWPLIGAAVVATVVVVLLVRGTEETPAKALYQIREAIREHDINQFQQYVEVEAVAISIIDQIFTLPSSVDKPLAARMTAFIKPELADELRDEILEAVKNGGTPTLPATNKKDVLGKLWADMGAAQLQWGKPTVAMEDGQMAVAELTITRPDINLSLPLQLVLSRNDEGQWFVVDVPNFSNVLNSMVEAQAAQSNHQATVAMGGNANHVLIGDINKAKSSKDAILLSMSISNLGTTPLKNLNLQVSFGDAAGQPMKTTTLKVDGTIAAGSSAEQTWTVPVDRTRPMERYIAELPLSALTVKVAPIGIDNVTK